MPTDALRLAAPPETSDDDPRVTTVMTSRLVAVTMDTSVSTALLLMAREGVRHLPVMQGRACVGLVLESDLVRCLAETGPLTAAAGLHVGEFARSTAPLPTSARRSEAAQRMMTECSRHTARRLRKAFVRPAWRHLAEPRSCVRCAR